MHVWLKENEARRALIVDTDRPSWVSHEAFYGYWMVALCLRLRWAQEKWTTEAEDGDPAFRAGEVYTAKKVLKHLAVLPIDKCQRRMLIE